MHSTHDPDEVQVDPRGVSDVTDEEEVQVCHFHGSDQTFAATYLEFRLKQRRLSVAHQVDPRKYTDGDREKFLDEPSFDYSPRHPLERSWQDEHHENKYCDVQCSHTCNYKAVSPSYLDNLIWRDSEVNHYYEPKLIIDLSNWKEQQSKEKADRKAKSKCEKNGLVKAQIALQEAEKTPSFVEKDSIQEKHQTERPPSQQNPGFDFDSFIASTIKLSLQPEPCSEVTLLSEVGLLNELNFSVSQLEAPRSSSVSKTIRQEKEEKCLVNLAQLGGGGLGVVAGDCVWPAKPWENLSSEERVGEPGCLIDEACWDIRNVDHFQKESTYTSYLDRLFSRKEEGTAEMVASSETESLVVNELDDSFLDSSAEIVLNMQLDSLALPGFDGSDDLPLKSIQASLTPCAVKCSPQIAHKTYSSIFKHLN